ncbi:MAG: major facilitator transporter [Glaciihabitans sp.]|nr:major facilitator transporter [Glaciihabitans sp.]
MSAAERANPTTGDTPLRRPRRRDIWILCAIVVVLMATVSTANLSVPVFAASSWNPTPTELTWYVDAYVIAFACFLLPGDMLGSRFGHGKVLLIGLALFCLANLGAALAPGLPALIIVRAIAGIGAALALPQTLSILLARSTPGRRAGVVAAWTASTSVAGVVGNGLGGFLIETFSWRSIFAVTVPLIAILMVLVAVLVGLDHERRNRTIRVDVAGMALFIVAAVSLLVIMIEAPAGMSNPVPVIIAVAAFVLAAIPFVMLELRRPTPMIDLRTFLSPQVRASALGIGVTFIALFALFSINAHFIQTARGLSPAIAGLSLVPVALTMFFVTHASVPLVRRFGVSPVVAVGMLISAAGYLLVVVWSTSAPLGVYEIALVIVGIGAGLCSSPLSTELTAASATERILTTGHPIPTTTKPSGAGLNSTLRELSSAVGVGLSGVVLATTTSHSLAAGTITGPDVLSSMHLALTVVAIALLAALVLMFIDIRLLSARRRRRALS